MGKRREGMDLYATILEVVKAYHGEARITRMSYGAGMPVDRLRPAVDRLLALGLLRSRTEEDRTCYEISLRGHEFLKTYWRLKGFVEALESSDGLPPEISAALRSRGPG
jgi:predicted transcriptional regulator